MKKREPGLKQLQSLFERYQRRLVAPEQVVLEAAVEVVDELLGLSLKTNQLRYTPATRTLHIANGMIRSEVLLHQQRILDHLRQRLGERSAPQKIV